MRRSLAVFASVVAVVAVGAAVPAPPAAARAGARIRACGQVDTRIPHTGAVKIFTVSRVSARRLSCARARGFVRTWERLGDHGKLPNAADGKIVDSTIVYDKWGRAYRVAGFVCRSLATQGSGPVQRELVNCGSQSGLVTWRESGRYG
jgi:hypothetical protein